MRNILLLVLTVVTCFMVACDGHDYLPPYTPTTIFNVNTSMSHTKDTILSKGDTIKIKAIGYVIDTTKTYSISATIKATDTTTALNLISGNYIKAITVKFDTVGYSTTNMYRWSTDTNSVYITIPALPAKTKIKTTALFTFGLNLSSQTGNNTATDSKFVYAK